MLILGKLMHGDALISENHKSTAVLKKWVASQKMELLAK